MRKEKWLIIVGIFVLLFGVNFVTSSSDYCGGLWSAPESFSNSGANHVKELFPYNGYSVCDDDGGGGLIYGISNEGLVEYCKLFFYWWKSQSASSVIFYTVDATATGSRTYSSPFDETIWKYSGGSWERSCTSSTNTGPVHDNIACSYSVSFKSCADSSICDAEGYECGTVSDCCSGTVDCGPTVISSASCSDNEYVCDEGWDNCNLDWNDGCEVSLVDDVANCGSCGISCIDQFGIGATCENSVCVNPYYGYWTDMNGDFDSSVDLNDYVRLDSSADLNYNITKDDVLFLEVDKRYWKADTTGNNYNFTTIDGSSENLINVSTSVEDSPLGVEVVQPSCGNNFTLGDVGTIEIIINDPDDLVYGDVTINGVWVMDFDNIINNTIIFNYSFDESGNVGIVVSANNTRGEKSKTTINVMVVDTSKTDYYVASCIDEPKNFDRFTSSRIKFDASSTLAIKFDSSDGSYREISKENLQFNWRFLLSTGKWGEPCVGLGSDTCPGSDEPIYAFHRRFPTVNDNKVFLTVSIPDSELN